MKRKVIICTILSVILAFFCVFVGCNRDVDPGVTYSLHYLAGEGGRISGKAQQTVAEGANGESVEAIAEDGYNFIGWSDGEVSPIRTDSDVTKDITVTANFERYVRDNAIVYSANNYKASNIKKMVIHDDLTVGTRVEITVEPEFGYYFLGWNDGNMSPTRSDVFEGTNLFFEAMFERNAEELPFYDDEALPVIYISTENSAPIESKEVYVKCTVSTDNTAEEYLLTNETGGIRGRGNSTWRQPKKPYRIKFDKKVDLFGNGAAKSWVLLANYMDFSLIRNDVTYAIGSLFETQQYTTTTQPVEVYLNGEYQGVYTVAEQTEVKTNRVDIGDTLGDVDMGYLLEMDVRASSEGVEDIDYITVYNKTYTIKSPDTDDPLFSSDYVNFIKNYLQQCWDAVGSGEWENVTEVIDVPSFVESYVVNKLVNNPDVRGSSFFMYKKAGDKLYSGPFWDYDTAIGNYKRKNPSETDGVDGTTTVDENVWYGALIAYPQFKELVKQKLEEKKELIVNTINDKIGELLAYEKSYNRNFEKWDVFGNMTIWTNSPQILAINTWEGQVEFVRNWLMRRIDFLTEYFDSSDF